MFVPTRWEFCTVSGDIGFGVYKRTDNASGKQRASDMEVCVPSQRVNSHMVAEDGNYTCSTTGTCMY